MLELLALLAGLTLLGLALCAKPLEAAYRNLRSRRRQMRRCRREALEQQQFEAAKRTRKAQLPPDGPEIISPR